MSDNTAALKERVERSRKSIRWLQEMIGPLQESIRADENAIAAMEATSD